MPRRTDPRSTTFIACAAITALAVFACSSRDDLLTFGAGTNDGESPPSFAEPESDAGGDALPPPLPDRCMSTECPAPFASCPYFSALPRYACGTDLSSDVENCGECGHECLSGADAHHFIAACSDGVCKPICVGGWYDCNGLPDDGCESDPKVDPGNCGTCGTKCPDGVSCIEGKCGCPPGLTDCGGVCVDLTSDDGHCGECNYACADHQPADAGAVPPNMFYGCRDSQCKDLRCYHDNNVFWADCNDSIEPDGCEIDLRQPNTEHCGKCQNECDPGQQCFWSVDTGMDCQCKNGRYLCPGDPGECMDLENDPSNCGSCGYTCPAPDTFIENADPACSAGRCSYKCQPGYADCNGREEDGCEASLNNDPRNCGACGNSCDVGNGQPCAGGRCSTVPCSGPGGTTQ